MTAVLVLALGIGLATAMFSLMDAVLNPTVPWSESEELVVIHAVRPDQRQNPALARTWDRQPISWAAWRDLQQSPAFKTVGVWHERQQVFGDDRSEIVTVFYASSSFFSALAVRPVAGRLFLPPEDDEMSEAMIISHEAWRRFFGGRSDIVGRTAALAYGHDSASATKVIAGVLPAGFSFQGSSPDFFLPIGLMAFNGSFESNRFLRAVGRLAPDGSIAQAQPIVEPLVRRLEPPERRTARVVSLSEDQFGAVARPIWLLLAGAGMLLSIACSNVAGLLLMDASVRRTEITTRVALGASRRHLVQQFAGECLLLALAASIAGVILAYWFTPLLASFAPPEISALETVSVSARVAAWSLGLGTATAFLFGIGPAWSLAATPVRSSGTVGTTGARRHRAAVAGQLALAFVLTVCAGLFASTLLHLQSQPLGFEPNGLAVARVRMTSAPPALAARRPDPEITGRAAVRAYRNSGWMHTDAIIQRLEGLPGVVGAAAASSTPFASTAPVATIRQPGRNDEEHSVQWRTVTEQYFDVMGIPIVRGRPLAASDRDYGTPYWAVVSLEGEARLAGSTTIGTELGWGPESLRVVGIAGDVRHHRSDRATPFPALYLINFRAGKMACFLVRVDGDPRELLPAIRQTIEQDRSIKVTATLLMSDLVADSVADERFRAFVSGLFGTAALLLASVGLFGLTSYLVATRRREIAVRLALGATASDVRRMVVRDVVAIVVTGVALGIPAAYWAFTVARAFLSGTTGSPFGTVISAVAVLCFAASAAVTIPVVRAGRIDPGGILNPE